MYSQVIRERPQHPLPPPGEGTEGDSKPLNSGIVDCSNVTLHLLTGHRTLIRLVKILIQCNKHAVSIAPFVKWLKAMDRKRCFTV